MPIAPEQADVPAEEGGVEVVHQLHTQHFGSSHCDGGIAAEVAVDLKSEENGSDDNKKTAEVCGASIDRIHQNGCPVGNNDFQEKAPEHQQKALPQIVKGSPVGDSQLGQQVL